MISDCKFSKNKLLKDICQKTTRTTYLGTLRMMQAALMSTAQKWDMTESVIEFHGQSEWITQNDDLLLLYPTGKIVPL